MIESTSTPVGPDRLIRLTDDDNLRVRPPDEQAFAAFDLPAIPMSFQVWLNGLIQTMYSRYQRSMVVGLLLDCQRRRCGPPIVPRQECCTDGVSWRFASEDFRNLAPQLRLAGTIQSGSVVTSDEELARVPPIDGIHLYIGLSPFDPSMRWYLKMGSEVVPTIAESLIEDDWQLLLAAASTKFRDTEP